ncbi:putative phosphatidylserine decarboxylase [Trypanosoma grayi]|uniref:putative phosphatidylserine decarboxylase n=1 Tax=Trypanosoma grayi TaxID=71804 RepID=UPI0004F419FE|nr:putative phosphatidylserine decarboxylase [Trypanosoma grayi]KEG07833.1 putative phosphatidylserine decarboxylase [Trypanosoma grayi]
MAALTRKLCFYKNDVTRVCSNPMRRWVYHYLFGGAVLGGGAYVWGRYQLAAWEAARHPEKGNWLCSTGMLELMLLLPFNYFSYVFGRFSESAYFAEPFHRLIIKAIVWWYGIDMSEAKQQEFATLQDFFVREWKSDARKLAAAPVLAPSDGIVLSAQDNVVEEQMVQVKGMTYSIRRLLHRDMGPVAEGEKRVAIVVHLRVRDYHHVIAPCSFNCSEVAYIPGSLLPHTPAGYHWIPSLLPLNERVVLLGRADNNRNNETNRSSSSSSNGSNIGLALVGGTLTGRIAIHFDARIQTNFLNPPEYAVHRRYASDPLLCKGVPLSTFYWGSSVVLVIDVPQHASLSVKAGDVVKAGEALITY